MLSKNVGKVITGIVFIYYFYFSKFFMRKYVVEAYTTYGYF